MARGSGWGSEKGSGAAKGRRETRYTDDYMRELDDIF